MFIILQTTVPCYIIIYRTERLMVFCHLQKKIYSIYFERLMVLSTQAKLYCYSTVLENVWLDIHFLPEKFNDDFSCCTIKVECMYLPRLH